MSSIITRHRLAIVCSVAAISAIGVAALAIGIARQPNSAAIASQHRLGLLEYLATYCGAALVLAAGLYLCLGRQGIVRSSPPWVTQHYGRYAWIVCGLLALASGVLLRLAFPAATAPRPLFHSLEITATGQHNPAARGSEVWLQGIFLSDEAQVSPTDLALGGGWGIRDSIPYADHHQEPALRWARSVGGDVQLHLLSHPWSGIAQIAWDGHVQTVDLYSAQTKSTVVALPSYPTIPDTLTVWLREGLFLGADVVSLGVLALQLALWLPAAFRRGSSASGRRGYWTRGPLLALLLCWQIAPAILAHAPPLNQLRLIDYPAAWLYALLVVAVCWLLGSSSAELLGRLSAFAPPRPGWFGRVVLGQTRGAWLVASLIVIAAAFVAMQFVVGTPSQHALWLNIALDSPRADPPAARLKYNDDATIPITWQPYQQSIVAVRPLDAGQSKVQILAVDTDRGSLDLGNVTVSGGLDRQAGLSIPSAEGALLSWPEPSRAFTLTLAPGRGSVDVLWLDQQTRVSLGDRATQVALHIPATFQGWALLPAREIDQIALELPPGDEAYQIRHVEVRGDDLQSWDPATAPSWPAQGCDLRAKPGSLTIQTTPFATCLVRLPDLRPVNVSRPELKLLVWLAIALALLVALWVVTLIAHQAQRLAERYTAGVPEARSVRLPQRHGPPARVLWVTWGIVLLVHLIYALSMPVAYTADSIGYYRLGQAFAQTGQLASINLIRTPGYPIFIAALIRLFGDTALWIVVFQHLALSLLAPLTIWALAERVPPTVAIAAGVLAGLSPAVSVTANLLWTETLFAVCATAALLIYIRRGETIRGLLLAGILVGFATMVRPTGVLILLSLLGWMLLCGWWNGRCVARQRLALVSCIALTAGYLVTAGPWHMYLGLTQGTADLSGGQAGFTAWAAAVYQRRITADLPINQPDRAVWAMPQSWDNDPFIAFNYAQPMATGVKAANPQYYTAALAEAAQADPARLSENRLDALVYNLTFQWVGDSRQVVWNELSWFLNLWNRSIWQPGVGASAADGSIEKQLERMAYRWQPEQSPARSACIAVSLFVLQNWIWLAIPALISLFVLLVAPAGRALVPGGLYWLALVVSASALGMPVERYIVVAEPLIYIFLSVALFILWNLRNRRSIQIAPAEQLIAQDYAESTQL